VGAPETQENASSMLGVYKGGGSYATIRDTTTHVEGLLGADSTVVLAAMTDHPLVFRAGNGVGGGNAEYMRINRGGNVGIGRTASANRLEVEGNASKTAAGSWLANSDSRIKQDIEPVGAALETLAKVHPVSFRYTESYRAQHPCLEDRRYVNVVAQDFREVFPEHVKSSGEKLPDGSEILQVDTYPLTIYSVAAIQELNDENKRKDARIAELEHRLATLEKLIQSNARKAE